MKNYYILNYDGCFIRDDFHKETVLDTWAITSLPLFKILTVDGMTFLRQIKIYPNAITRVFIGSPNQSTHIHSDTPYSDFMSGLPVQSYALNYVFSDTKSKMKWFFTERPDVCKPVVGTIKDTYYMTYDKDQVKLIEEIDVPNNTLMLVRIDIPHQVTNYSDKQRYCLSIRGNPLLTWEKAVDYFKPYILEES